MKPYFEGRKPWAKKMKPKKERANAFYSAAVAAVCLNCDKPFCEKGVCERVRKCGNC